MRRRIVSFLAAASLMAASASPALADAGAPGETFPEQPGDNGQTGCMAITTNSGSGLGGRRGEVVSETADSITRPLLTDACFGG
jgi:hypothetical protein